MPEAEIVKAPMLLLLCAMLVGLRNSPTLTPATMRSAYGLGAIGFSNGSVKGTAGQEHAVRDFVLNAAHQSRHGANETKQDRQKIVRHHGKHAGDRLCVLLPARIVRIAITA